MDNRQRLIVLYNDPDFKSQFISNYLNSPALVHKCSESFAQREYMNAFSLLSTELNLQQCPVKQIRSAFLQISEMGLSFDKQEKHVHLSAAQGPNSQFTIQVIIGYKGMQRMVMETGKFSYFFTQLVHEGDEFNWLGANEMPVFTSTGDTCTNRLICGYVAFVYTDGNCLCYKMDGNELEKVAADDRAKLTGYHNVASLYDSEWKNRLFEISVWRNAFNRLKEVILSRSSLGNISSDGQLEIEEPVANADFLNQFEKVLNSQDQSS